MYQVKATDLLKLGEVTLTKRRGWLYNAATNLLFGAMGSQNRNEINVLVSPCNRERCANIFGQRAFWVSLSDLDDAEGCIECDTCGNMLHPVKYQHGNISFVVEEVK